MRHVVIATAAVLGIAASIAGDSTTAKAERWDTVGRCLETVEGIGTGRGVFGRGSARARVAARRDWENAAAEAYGPGFARFSRAVDVRWDCKQRAVLLAKCVVTAKPCGARTRG